MNGRITSSSKGVPCAHIPSAATFPSRINKIGIPGVRRSCTVQRDACGRPGILLSSRYTHWLPYSSKQHSPHWLQVPTSLDGAVVSDLNPPSVGQRRHPTNHAHARRASERDSGMGIYPRVVACRSLSLGPSFCRRYRCECCHFIPPRKVRVHPLILQVTSRSSGSLTISETSC